jgi:hypothetical protein
MVYNLRGFCRVFGSSPPSGNAEDRRPCKDREFFYPGGSMSEWIKLDEPEDIQISDDGKELEILFETNDFGNRYLTIPISWIDTALAYAKLNKSPESQCDGIPAEGCTCGKKPCECPF